MQFQYCKQFLFQLLSFCMFLLMFCTDKLNILLYNFKVIKQKFWGKLVLVIVTTLKKDLKSIVSLMKSKQLISLTARFQLLIHIFVTFHTFFNNLKFNLKLSIKMDMQLKSMLMNYVITLGKKNITAQKSKFYICTKNNTSICLLQQQPTIN